MKLAYLLLIAGLVSICCIYSCSKNTNPTPPHQDTTIITKTDTVTKIVPPPPDSTVNLKLGLLLYLPFDGNIADSSGNGNPTVAVGGNVLTYDAHGYANNAFGGNGTGQEILVTNNGSIDFDTAFSVSFDFMINAVQQQVFISMVNPVNGQGPSFIVDASIPGLPNLSFFANDVTGSCSAAGQTTVQNPNVIADTSIAPVPGSWYNAICIYHKGTIQFYVNGVLTNTLVGPGTAALLSPQSQIVVGGWWNTQPLTLNGKLDEVRLYNRVLTPHEIVTLSQHFQVTSESTQTKLVSHKL